MYVNRSMVITIVDDDKLVVKPPPLPEISFEETTLRVDEGKGVIEIRVKLSKPSDKEVTIDLIVEDGTAKKGEDFLEAPATLLITPGENEKTMSIELVED